MQTTDIYCFAYIILHLASCWKYSVNEWERGNQKLDFWAQPFTCERYILNSLKKKEEEYSNLIFLSWTMPCYRVFHWHLKSVPRLQSDVFGKCERCKIPTLIYFPNELSTVVLCCLAAPKLAKVNLPWIWICFNSEMEKKLINQLNCSHYKTKPSLSYLC